MTNINFTRIQTPSNQELIESNIRNREGFVLKLQECNRIKNGQGTLSFTNDNGSDHFTKLSFVNHEGTKYNDWLVFLNMNVREYMYD